jgi:excisionase family DNA binding protein
MISLKDLCSRLNVERRTIMRLIRRRELRAYCIAHQYRVAVVDIQKYLDRISTH